MPLPYPTGKLAGSHERIGCVQRCRQLGRSGVTSTALHGKGKRPE